METKINHMNEFPGIPDPAEVPALALAYLGDAVYELLVRRYLISCGYMKVDKLHKLAVGFVNAGTQAQVLHALSGILNETEEGVVRRGRNAKGSIPKNVSMSDYRHGTAFESLIGYLYLTGRQNRIQDIFEIACKLVLSGKERDK
jgi:ribonuclease-3 family protein